MLGTHQVAAELREVERGVPRVLQEVMHHLVFDDLLVQQKVVSDDDHMGGSPVAAKGDAVISDVIHMLPLDQVEVTGESRAGFKFSMPLAINSRWVHQRAGRLERGTAGFKEEEKNTEGFHSFILPSRSKIPVKRLPNV